MVQTKCHKCGYVWTYRGKRWSTATCPNCRAAVKIKQNKKPKEERAGEGKVE